MTERLPRSVWVFVGCCAVLTAILVFVPRNTEPKEYTDFLPPDTIHLRLPIIDSIGRVTARCFGKPERILSGVLWYTTDASLGTTNVSGYRLRAQGRYFRRDRSVVLMRRDSLEFPAMIAHEWRHHVTGELGHPAAIFEKVCR